MKKFISALLAFIMISSLTACGNGSSELPPSQSEPATQNQNAVPPDSTGIDSEEPTDDNQETANFLIVDSFIDSFNANSDDKITDIEEININDRDGGHYRTEFRLLAFKNAPAKYGHIGNSSIEIINYGSMGRDEFRVYVLADSVDSLQNIFKITIQIFDPSISEEQIQEVIEDSATGTSFYLGSDVSGTCDTFNGRCEFMVDCSNIDFSE